MSENSTLIPDNKQLLHLLEVYHQQQFNTDIHQKIIQELSAGNSWLLLSSISDGKVNEWVKHDRETKLDLTCVQQIGDQKVLAAFTDEESLLAWTRQPTQYTLMAAQDVLQLCAKNHIDRIVINSDQPTMFVLEKNRNV